MKALVRLVFFGMVLAALSPSKALADEAIRLVPPPCAGEIAFFTAQLRTEVASRFMRAHGVRPSEEFWSTTINGVSPGEVLEQEVEQTMARARAIQQMAVDLELQSTVKSFSELVAEYHEENRLRREMKDRGEVFYGPVHFRQDVWFEMWQDRVLRALEIHARSRFPEVEDRTDREAAARKFVEEALADAITRLLSPGDPFSVPVDTAN